MKPMIAVLAAATLALGVTATNAQAASGGAFAGPNGAKGMRASQTTVNADGSASRTGGFATSGTQGTVQSSGSATRTADGVVSGERTTSATGAQGGTYNASTTYQSGQGVTRTATCSNAAGDTVACPTKK
jgi:hypothetical protein